MKGHKKGVSEWGGCVTGTAGRLWKACGCENSPEDAGEWPASIRVGAWMSRRCGRPPRRHRGEGDGWNDDPMAVGVVGGVEGRTGRRQRAGNAIMQDVGWGGPSGHVAVLGIALASACNGPRARVEGDI